MRASVPFPCDPWGRDIDQAVEKRGVREMNAYSDRVVPVEPGRVQVADHVGLHAIGNFTDRLGLGHSLSTAVPLRGERAPLHDRGKVLIQMAVVLAGGRESFLDIKHLRAQRVLFGSLPSGSTVWRRFHELSGATLEGMRGGRCARTSGYAQAE